MWVILLVASVVLCRGDCPLGPANPEDRRVDREKIRLATFNAEWLFPGDDKSPWTSDQAEQHLTDVSVAISELNADVVAMQEVYDCDILDRLIAKLDNLGATGYKRYLVKGTDTATQQNVALITRVDPISNVARAEDRVAYPLPGNTCGYNGTNGTYGVSKHFFARFNISGRTYTFFNHHFLAYPTTPDRCAQREAQASVMRGFYNQAILQNDEIVAFGDYNDYSDKVPDAVDDIPTSRVMRILREGLLGSSLKFQTDPTLYEVSNRVNKPNRYTNVYNTNSLSMIDHLLVSHYVSDHIITADVAHLYPPFSTSDHWPFYVDISTT